MKRGFTLLELIVVIIIMGVLATLGFTQYVKVIEKSRTSEARMILGSIRTAQESYKLERGVYTATIGDLSVEAPTGCVTTHYFKYSADATEATATRCTAGGKTPNATSEYLVKLNYATGVWSGTTGYY